MKRIMIVAIVLHSFYALLAQKTTVYRLDTFKVGHLMDTALQKNHIYTEFSLDLLRKKFFVQPMSGIDDGRDLSMMLVPSFKVGFFPVKRLLIGWDFTPQIAISNLGVEGFRWSTGPFIKYYFPFYRINKHKELKSPFALYVFFNYNFGQYNPIVLDRSFDTRFTTGFAIGIGFQFKLSKNLCLIVEFGPRYDFFADEFESARFTQLFKIGLNYSFPSKLDKAQRKYKRIHR